MKWIKQTFCMHSVIKTTDEEMEKTGYCLSAASVASICRGIFM